MTTDGDARLPVHVGIIMDGNGRWAQRRGKARSRGHLEGVRAAKRVVRAASQAGIRYVTLYTFSTENWNRSPREVSFLMFLIKNHLRREYKFYRDNGIRVVHSGRIDRIPPDVARELERVVRETAELQGMTVNLAIDYGGRDEVVRAVNRLIADGATRPLTAQDIRSHLDQPQIPDPDLVIRTGGECRLSNFLLWEMAYAELYFSAKLWPEWGEAELLEALKDYGCRYRRFGGDGPEDGEAIAKPEPVGRLRTR
ncbi:MAG: di-trans,poly-cis-decaprenylcistransferase [Spirochaetales bacterium]|nr:di-trans,poly-cis-decaprenylcistransferase [Spirochaetales bacterium]